MNDRVSIDLEQTHYDDEHDSVADSTRAEPDFNDDGTLQECGVMRSDDKEEAESKRRSMGFFASFLSCGVVIGFNELINHEGARKVTDHLLTLIKMGGKIPNALIYDSACTLKLFWRKNYGGEHFRQTRASKQLFEMRMAVDRFHRRNHVHPMCNTITNPDCAANGNDEIYEGINTGIAEQSFRYLSEFKLSLRRLAFPTSTLFSFLLLHLWNCRQTKLSPDSHGIGQHCMADKIKPMFLTYCIHETCQMDPSTSMDASSVDVNNDEDGDDNDVEQDNSSAQQLNYNCSLLLDQYAWESDDGE